jgi:hypothetical protein
VTKGKSYTNRLRVASIYFGESRTTTQDFDYSTELFKDAANEGINFRIIGRATYGRDRGEI